MEIVPFQGWRYAAEGGDVGRFLAPPYDILAAQDKRQLLAACGENIVAVDLPHVPAKELGPDELYRQAAATLEQWKSSGRLRQDPNPALYACEQVFTWAGRPYRRRALVCGVRVGGPSRDIIPHESIFAGPKADRLRLTELTRMQLSPILAFYHDTRGAAQELRQQTDRPPDAQGQLGPVQEKLWVVSDRRAIADVQAALRGVPAFIADGHHRYATAIAYRHSLRASAGIDDHHPANSAMFVLVAQEDPGLLVLPTHRIVRRLADGFLPDRLAAATEFSWQRLTVPDGELRHAEAILGRWGPGALGFVGPKAGVLWVARLTDEQAMLRAAPDALEAWRRLDVAVLHRLILERALTPWRTETTSVEYTPDPAAVVAEIRAGRAQLGALLQPTSLSAVVEIALAGAPMPHKSTYFYPKPATGLVLKPLE